MKTLLLTNEYPPYVYGGAGVHIEFLSRELAQVMDVEVRCFGDQHFNEGRLRVRGFSDPSDLTAPPQLRPVFGAMLRDLNMAATATDADLVHCHTWYSHLAGIAISQGYGIPLVVTVHSLEPLRPWKREQLGGGYDLSCWVEQTALGMADAVIAVSHGTRDDILRVTSVSPERIHVIYNGIDTRIYRPETATDALERFGIDPAQPYVLFVGRITRQKGIVHLARAIPMIDPAARVVLCAGAPDTPEIAAEMEAAVAEALRLRGNVTWIREMLPREKLIQFYSHATVFCCPSIYEPFGIINLEAMACGTPVVASAVGGIPEVVIDGETGVLVALDQRTESPFEPLDPKRFSADLASAINRLLCDAPLRRRLVENGHKRVESVFAWPAIARQTADVYSGLTLG